LLGFEHLTVQPVALALYGLHKSIKSPVMLWVSVGKLGFELLTVQPVALALYVLHKSTKSPVMLWVSVGKL
jgi:hypothetical protein